MLNSLNTNADSGDDTAKTEDVAEDAGATVEDAKSPVEDPKLGDAGKKALDRERAAHKAAAKRAAEAEARLRSFEEAKKNDAEKQAEELEKVKTALAHLQADNARLAAAAKTGVPAEILAGPGDDIEAFADTLKEWARTQGASGSNDGKTSSGVSTVGRQPESRGNVSIDMQIAEAEKIGEKATVKALKAMKLGQMPAVKN